MVQPFLINNVLLFQRKCCSKSHDLKRNYRKKILKEDDRSLEKWLNLF